MISTLPRYNTMKCQLQSMSGTLLGTCRKMSATIQNKFSGILPTTKCQLLPITSGIIPRNVRYMSYNKYTWNCQVLKCHIHDLEQIWLEQHRKLGGPLVSLGLSPSNGTNIGEGTRSTTITIHFTHRIPFTIKDFLSSRPNDCVSS